MKSIAVNGIGTIGKRVADAVSAQDDMKIVGVCKTKPDFEARAAIEKGYDYIWPYLKENNYLKMQE